MMKSVPIILSIFVLLILSSLFMITNPVLVIESFFSKEVLFALYLSVVTATLATILASLIAIPTAYSLAKNEDLGKWVEPLLTLPASIPPVAVGATLLLFFTNNPIGGMLNQLFNIVFNVPGLVVAQASVAFPFVLRTLKSSFKMLDEDLEIISRVYGCTGVCMFKEVLLPAAKPGLKEGSILAFARALGEFGASVTLAGAIRFKTETLPIAIYLNLSSGDIPKLISLIVISIIVSITVLRIGGELGAAESE
ncbi:nitrate ABC transporter [Ignicoccus pacificus DSM 13166]|uniref:Nitrate ABC transporter n=1 Tax=Ignicoccus pacificus DSM 13166 TaxID=940294 RepID=A0A977KBK1_9CREN|nr:nitrate ABC transporter [Ignicoccus pacificus DSM 13166]